MALSVEYTDTSHDLAYGCILERPKVLYNEAEKRFVMYFKYYPKGMGYKIAYVGVAVSDSPTGPFMYSHKFLGCGSDEGSGDFCMFRDRQGAVRHYSVRKPDKQFCYGALRDDLLYPAGEYCPLEGIPLHTEAPAMVWIDGMYYLLGSGSSDLPAILCSPYQ
ncbi:hypothetical protein FACS1894159_11440 [Bacteroidia bacterium]|nr:hypothetical protein FACS1894159_11440 [Bacteroidia bacterium]